MLAPYCLWGATFVLVAPPSPAGYPGTTGEEFSPLSGPYSCRATRRKWVCEILALKTPRPRGGAMCSNTSGALC